MDKFSFKVIMIIISIIEFIICGTFYALAGTPVIFVIELLLVACCLSGTFTTITPLFNKKFNDVLGPLMYGLTGFFIGVASITGPILVSALVPKDPESSDFLITYLIGGGFCLVKFIALLFFKENEPYRPKNPRISLIEQDDELGKIDRNTVQSDNNNTQTS